MGSRYYTFYIAAPILKCACKYFEMSSMLQNWVDIGLFGALPTYLTMWCAFYFLTRIADCTQARCVQQYETFVLLYSIASTGNGKASACCVDAEGSCLSCYLSSSRPYVV